jgi:hypothetical protein
MKTFKLYILIFLIFCSCNLKNDEKKNTLKTTGTYSSNNIHQTNKLDYYILGDSVATKPIKGHPQLSYKFNVDSTGYILKSIFVYSDLIKVQEIIANKNIERKEFQLVDFNSDGHKDISVLYNCGSGGCAYWIWNYSPKTQKYYYNKELSEVLGLETNSHKQFP